MNRRRSPLLVLLTLASAACAEVPADRSATARVDTLASGRVEVANTGEPIWTPETTWRLEEDLRLGTAAATGSEPEQFGSIRSVAADSRGWIYVLEGMAQEIRVFRPDGSFSHTIGRRGEGPGEFTFASELTITPGDTLWVLDDGMMRYSGFAPDGTFLESRRRDIVGYASSVRRAVLDDGRYVDWGLRYPDGRMGPRVLRIPVVYAPSFESADTFPPLGYTFPMLPSAGIPLWHFTGDVVAAVDREARIWFANSPEYRIYRRTLEGDTTLVFSLPVQGAPLGEPEREYVRERLSRLSGSEVAEALDALPETRPVVRGIVPDGAGHLFIFADVAGEPAGSVVDVFRESGEYLGRMTLPTPVPLPPTGPPVAHIAEDHLYVVVEDELDVPYVSRLRIVRGGR
ncbi:MAG: 6-bladed beta-propeller [Gemmatimonadota bacterium]